MNLFTQKSVNFFHMGEIYQRILAANKMQSKLCIRMIRAERWAERQRASIEASKTQQRELSVDSVLGDVF